MDIRIRALVKMLSYIIVIGGSSFAISWLFPVYGMIGIVAAVALYMMYLMYDIILEQMRYEEGK